MRRQIPHKIRTSGSSSNLSLFTNRRLRNSACILCLLGGFLAVPFYFLFPSSESISSTLSATFLGRKLLNGRSTSLSGNPHQIINVHDVEINVKRKLTRPRILAFVGVYTGFSSANRRRVLRESWFPSTPEEHKRIEEASGLVFLFALGYSKDPVKEAAIRAEAEQYKDFLRLDLEEGYHGLNKKTILYFRTAYQLFDAQYYVKADDDIYLRPDRLSIFLSKPRSNPRSYIGCHKKGTVIKDKRLKWFEPQGFLLGNEYFLHGYGPIYALSEAAVFTIVSMPPGSLRMFMNEDVTVGVWMLAMNASHETNFMLCSQQCTPKSIAVWDIPQCSGLCNPVKKIPELHAQDMCSKSPAIPAT